MKKFFGIFKNLKYFKIFELVLDIEIRVENNFVCLPKNL